MCSPWACLSHQEHLYPPRQVGGEVESSSDEESNISVPLQGSMRPSCSNTTLAELERVKPYLVFSIYRNLPKLPTQYPTYIP